MTVKMSCYYFPYFYFICHQKCDECKKSSVDLQHDNTPRKFWGLPQIGARVAVFKSIFVCHHPCLTILLLPLVHTFRRWTWWFCTGCPAISPSHGLAIYTYCQRIYFSHACNNCSHWVHMMVYLDVFRGVMSESNAFNSDTVPWR